MHTSGTECKLKYAYHCMHISESSRVFISEGKMLATKEEESLIRSRVSHLTSQRVCNVTAETHSQLCSFLNRGMVCTQLSVARCITEPVFTRAS